MNLQETKDTILRWIESCNTSEQIGLCYESIQEFIVRRFKGEPGMDEAVHELTNAAVTRETNIVMSNGVWDEKPISKKEYYTLN